MESIIFTSRDELMHKLAQELVSYSREDNPVNIGLSGGNTPQAFFKLLATPEYAGIDWNKIHFWWCDERLVDPNSPESNYGNAKRLLLDHIQIPAGNIHRIQGETSAPATEAARYAQELRDNIPQLVHDAPNFDWILLGIGEDGHTASLFPGVNLNTDNLTVVTQHPVTHQQRITLSAKILTAALRITFVVTGGGKAQIIQDINNNITNPYPAGNIKSTVGTTEWFLDPAAGQYIK